MQGIVYVSEAQMYFDNLSLEALAADAAARNLEMGITGYLYFEKDRFVQYIEGDEAAISQLIDAISRDRRHEVVHMIVEPDLTERRFPSWHMRYLSRKELIEIKLEHVLTDYLLYLDNMKSASSSVTQWESVVWGMVNRLSSLRGELSHQ